MRLQGLGADANLQFVPASNATNAKVACAQVGGVWQDATQSFGFTPGDPAGCTMDVGSEGPPDWCSLPLMVTLFPETCGPETVAQLAAYGNYTAYQTAQLQQGQYTPPGQAGPAPVGTDASAALIAANLAQSNALVASDCDYMASATWPELASMVSPPVARMLTNPFSTDCTNTDGFFGGVPGWVLYTALGLGAYLLIKRK